MGLDETEGEKEKQGDLLPVRKLTGYIHRVRVQIGVLFFHVSVYLIVLELELALRLVRLPMSRLAFAALRRGFSDMDCQSF